MVYHTVLADDILVMDVVMNDDGTISKDDKKIVRRMVNKTRRA